MFYYQVNPNPAYTHSQEIKRSDPVYLTSMASHGVWHNHMDKQQQQIEYQQQQQLELQHQQQLELQQRSCQNQILAEQLGGFVTPNSRPDLIHLMDSMQME